PKEIGNWCRADWTRISRVAEIRGGEEKDHRAGAAPAWLPASGRTRAAGGAGCPLVPARDAHAETARCADAAVPGGGLIRGLTHVFALREQSGATRQS